LDPIDIAVSRQRNSNQRNSKPGQTLGLAAEELRRHNLAIVLERLHVGGPLSRSELTSTTGLNRSTIAGLIGQLATLGLVDEGPGLAATGPGRPSPIVATRPDGATVLAVELAVDSIAVATIGLGGHIYNRVRVTRPRERFSPQQTVQDVANLARPLLEALPANHVMAGVGVSVVGITRRSDGFVHLAPNLGWHNVPLGAMMAGSLSMSGAWPSGLEVPAHVLVANDADLGALAEQRRGVGSGIGHLIYVHGEVGIGTGVILDGQPLLGSAGYAGEAGHMQVNLNGLKCRCGATGCWETEAGEAALVRLAGLPPTVTGLEILDTVEMRAEAGDPVTLAAIAEVAKWLGLGLGNLINILNPELVIMGGAYERLFPYLEEALLESVRSRALRAPAAMVKIVASGLGSDAPLVGAAELVLSKVISDPASTDWRSTHTPQTAAKH
jgi:predicted NBD/HSP70 family sugar kinase